MPKLSARTMPALCTRKCNPFMSQKHDPSGVRLLKKWQKGFWNLLFSRMLLVIPLLLLQFGILFSMFSWLEEFLPHILGGQFLLTAGMVLCLLNSAMEPTAKTSWLVLIMATPVFGSLLYLFSRKEFGHRAMRKRVRDLTEQTTPLLSQSQEVGAAFQRLCPGAAAMAQYVRRNGGYPVYRNTEVTYFPVGEEKFRRLLEELEHAKHFIYLEYFIIEEGTMWGQILEILIRKAAEGVDVRVIYDGTCEFMLLPKGYPEKLASFGIRCKVFSPFIPLVSTHYNYRDHRKILVIDGHTAFNGGINLADEYINAKQKFGHWKDTAVMLKGEAVQSFTLMFLRTWNLDEKQPEFPTIEAPLTPYASGFVMPYADCPLDNSHLGKRVYLDLLSRAKHSLDIMTPYLILDAELEEALKYAAGRGVRLRLILPGIPDKKIPYALAKTYYSALLEAGVEIYEYTPGFVHAKVFLCDQLEAVVGTINLDYRSLAHHFECGTYLYGTDCLNKIQQDFNDTLEKCRRIEKPDLKKIKWTTRLLGKLCKPFAPLL